MKINLLIVLLLNITINTCYASDEKQNATVQLKQIKVNSTITSLMQYAASGDINTVQLLIKSGLDVNAHELNFGATALHNAAAQGHLKMVKWLVKNGANVNSTDKLGNTAQSWAKYHQHEKVEKFLKTHKNTITSTKSTILDYPNQVSTTEIKVPQSSFHDWKQADDEAQKIINDWQTHAVTIPWTKLQLQRYIKHKIMPGKSARGLALTHVAMYDALMLAQENNSDTQITVSTAAAEVLAYIFPPEEKAFKRTVFSLAAQKYQTDKTQLPVKATKAIKLGKRVASQVINHAQNDGAQRGWNGNRLQWYGEGRYYGPGSWEPTPPYFYYPPEEPYAPTWKTWVLKKGNQFRSTAPPLYASIEFVKALKEVIEINKNLTKKQLKAAQFWVDGHGTVTPAGHWNQIAMDASQNSRLDDKETAKLFALLNITLADTYIAAWDTKYHYWSIRPVTAAKKLLNIKFKPAILTPPFPSYVSGHAATSGAAAKILSHYFSNNAKHLTQLGKDAAMSRLHGGIHYRFDNDEGLIQGRKVAQLVLAKFNQTDEINK